MSKPKIIVICGPTASGKTALSIQLAKKINGETKGVYLANETIYVEYVYAKNIGDGEVEIMPPQTGVETKNQSIMFRLLSLIMVVCGGIYTFTFRKKED